MAEPIRFPDRVERRLFLKAAVALAGVGIMLDEGVVFAQEVEPPLILSREVWADGLEDAPAGLEPEDVKFLLVHHTKVPDSSYKIEEVPGLLRSIHAFHTGPEKQWPDIAYNFFVDKFGRIIEARAGSLAGPIRGSATGGNQGFSQLCCFLGDLSTEPPTAEAQAAMAWLLAWLASRYELDLDPERRVTFVSLGSNRWPVGEQVETSIIAGHRDMSLTECPGDACYSILQSDIGEAARRKARIEGTATSVPPASSSTTILASTTTLASTSTTLATTSLSAAASTQEVQGARQAGQTSTTELRSIAMPPGPSAGSRPAEVRLPEIAAVSLAIASVGFALVRWIGLRRSEQPADETDG